MTTTEKQTNMMNSTYKLLIAETVLGQFGISIDSKTLLEELQNPQSVYSKIIYPPTLNILNQLISAQITSYQHFVQKKLVDYYTQYAAMEEGLEEEDVELMHSEAIQQMKQSFLHEKKASSYTEQKLLDEVAMTNQIIYTFLQKQAISARGLQQLNLLEFDEKILPSIQNALELRQQLIELRKKWHDFATDFIEKLSHVISFQMDEITDLELRSELRFFQELGVS